jgi:hypothetical protein
LFKKVLPSLKRKPKKKNIPSKKVPCPIELSQRVQPKNEKITEQRKNAYPLVENIGGLFSVPSLD